MTSEDVEITFGHEEMMCKHKELICKYEEMFSEDMQNGEHGEKMPMQKKMGFMGRC